MSGKRKLKTRVFLRCHVAACAVYVPIYSKAIGKANVLKLRKIHASYLIMKNSVLNVGNAAKIFPGYIGNRDVTLHLATIVEHRLANPNAELACQFFGGLAGSGKTELARACAKALAPAGFEFIEIDNSTTLPVFMQTWANCIEGKEVVIFIDEVHNLKNKKVIDVIKRLTELGGDFMRDVRVGESFFTADKRKQWWIAASNMEAIDQALFGHTGRFNNLTLQPLLPAEAMTLFLQMSEAKDLKVHKEAAELLIDRCFPNGRSIRNLVRDLSTYIKDGRVTIEAARELIQRTKRFPMGLIAQDVKVLFAMKDDPRGKQVGELAAQCGGESPKVMQERLRELTGLALVQTNTGGRKALTEKGVEYVQKVAEAQKRAKARKAEAAKTEKGKKTVKESAEKPVEAK